MSTVDISHIDEDDRFLIETLHKNGKSIEGIATRLSHAVEIVTAVLAIDKNQQFDKIGHVCRREKDFRKASFWYYQHQIQTMDGEDYLKYTNTIKRAESDWPGWGNFLEGEYTGNGVTPDLEWTTVEKMWAEKHAQYQDNPEEEVALESLIGQHGGKTISIDVEEHHMTAVCKIQFQNAESGSGCLVKIDDNYGIITTDDVLSTAQICKNTKAIFENLDGEEVVIRMEPGVFFITDEDLGSTFVSCNYDPNCDDHEDIQALSKLGEVKEECPVYSYFHLNGGEKVAIQQKVKTVANNNIGFDGELKKGSRGAPLYCEDKLVAVTSGRREKDLNTAGGIKAIEKWIKEQLKNGFESTTVSYVEREKVSVQWSDSFWYDGQIKNVTPNSNGQKYKVIYLGFDEEEDVTLDRIRKLKGVAPVVNTQTLSLDDQDTIRDFLKNGKDCDYIAQKLPNRSKEAIQAVIAQEKFQKVVAFLNLDNCGKYADNFKKSGYDDLDKIYIWKPDDIREKLIYAGCKRGAVEKIHKRIMVGRSYIGKGKNHWQQPQSGGNTSPKQPQSVQKKRILNVNPQTMPDGFTPSGSQLNLTHEFLKPDGSSSVSTTGTKLMNGFLPKSLNPGVTHFYIMSSRHKRYFKLDIQWSD